MKIGNFSNVMSTTRSHLVVTVTVVVIAMAIVITAIPVIIIIQNRSVVILGHEGYFIAGDAAFY